MEMLILKPYSVKPPKKLINDQYIIGELLIEHLRVAVYSFLNVSLKGFQVVFSGKMFTIPL